MSRECINQSIILNSVSRVSSAMECCVVLSETIKRLRDSKPRFALSLFIFRKKEKKSYFSFFFSSKNSTHYFILA